MRTKPCLTSADAHKMMAACKAEAVLRGQSSGAGTRWLENIPARSFRNHRSPAVT